MALIPQTCPNCGAPVRVEQNAHTDCRYCHSPLYFPAKNSGNEKESRELPADNAKLETPRNVKSSQGAPIPFIVLWIGVCAYIAANVGGSRALIPIGMAVFGAYMMISGRKRNKRR